MSFGLLFALGLAACGYIPRAVEGVPPGLPWEALPLRKWLAEDRAEPQALAFCAPPECRPGLAVSVIDLNGRDADISEAVLDHPDRLARALISASAQDKRNEQNEQSKQNQKVRTLATASTIHQGSSRGFAISLAPSDGGKPPAYGAALGQRSGNALRIVLVIGEDEASVLSTVREVAGREMGS